MDANASFFGSYPGVAGDSQPGGHWVGLNNFFDGVQIDISELDTSTFSLDSGHFATLDDIPVSVTFTGYDAEHNAVGSETHLISSPTFLTFGSELQNVSDVAMSWDSSDNLVFDNLQFNGTLAPSVATSSTNIRLTTNPVSELADLSTPSLVTVDEDATISLGISVTPHDGDDTVSITISGVPSGRDAVGRPA